MPTLRDVSWFEPPLFGDDRLRCDVHFHEMRGWFWSVQHRESGMWHVLDSGTSGSWTDAIHQTQRVLGELGG